MSLEDTNRKSNSVNTTDETIEGPNSPSGELPVIPGYEILSEIARKHRSVVYRAKDRTLDRDVAIKIWRSAELGTESSSRIADSCRLAGQLQHPGVPPVFATGTLPDGQNFLVMKLVRGDTLADLLKARANPSADCIRFVSVFKQLAETLAYAHAHRVVHGHLKPQHVMIGEFGDVQLVGWGSARLMTDHEAGPVVRQIGVMSTGSPAYMSPEQARGEWDKLDFRADVFALGGILTEILTGKPTFPAYSAAEATKKSSTGDLSEAFSRLDFSGEDVDLIAIAKRCLNPNHALRPAHAGEVVTLISGYRLGIEERLRTSEAERLAATALTEEKAKRKQWQLALLLVVGVFVIWNGAFIWWHNKQAAVARILATTQEKNAKDDQHTAERERLESEKRAREAQERMNILRKRRQLDLEREAKQQQRFQEEHTAPPPREVK